MAPCLSIRCRVVGGRACDLWICVCDGFPKTVLGKTLDLQKDFQIDLKGATTAPNLRVPFFDGPDGEMG